MKGYTQPPSTKGKDKFQGFLAVTPNKKFMKLFERAEVCNVLISYHYIRKNPKLAFEFMQQVRDRGGLFMTDSGAFSFLNDPKFKADDFDWYGYVNEYAEWLNDHKEYIFTACNLDVDAFVGHETVLGWNEKFFEPLQKDFNVAFVAHQNVLGRGELDAFNYYTDTYDMVAVNESFASHVSSIYQRAKIKKVNVHGLAWTKPTLLTDFPFFSVDSSSWVNYQKYGATPVWDGKNFFQYDKDKKDERRRLRGICNKYGVKFYEFCHEVDEGTTKHNDDEGLTYSLRTWLDVFEHIKRFAKTKLVRTIGDSLEGKSTVFMEKEEEEKPKKSSMLDGLIGERTAGLSVESAKPITVMEDEDGDEVVVYNKRAKESITAFKERTGDTMICNHCYVGEKCPKYKEDATCAFDFSPADQTANPMSVIDHLIKLQNERVNRAMYIEQMEGGMPNKTFASEMKLLQQLNTEKTNMMMMIQTKGVVVTRTEYKAELGGGEEKSQGGGGFKEMLMDSLKKNKD